MALIPAIQLPHKPLPLRPHIEPRSKQKQGQADGNVMPTIMLF